MPEKIPKKVSDLCDLMLRYNRSGCLKITDPKRQCVTWELYYQDNYIYYITTNIGQQERLSCLCKYFVTHFLPPKLLFNMGDYESIVSWGKSIKLPPSQFQQLLFQLIEEGLFQILTIEKPIIKFSSNQQILSPIAKFSLESILNSAYTKSTNWNLLCPQHLSPFNRLYLDSSKSHQFYQFWKSQKTLGHKESSRISFWLLNLAQKKSIYRLSQERGILPLSFVRDFRHLLKTNLIDILPFSDNLNHLHNRNKIFNQKKSIKLSTTSSPIIACVDDSHTVQKHIQKMLEIMGYRTLSLTDSTSCLTTLEKYDIKLILMDINMPEVNGYELFNILKKSNKLKNVPIVILTGRDKLIDKLRAKMLGVDYYLTKPCQPKELFTVVKQLTQTQSVKLSEASYIQSS
ncbi:MAG: response regulator [Crocosphaera sp.]